MTAGGEWWLGATASVRAHWESRERGFDRLGSFLTPRRSSCGSRATAGSGEAAAWRAPESGGDGNGGGGSGTRVCVRRQRLRVGAVRARVRALNRGSGGSWVCGPEADCGGVKPDLSSSPGPARGEEEGPDRRAPPISAREGRKDGARGRFWAGGTQLGPQERGGGAGEDGPCGEEKKRRKNGKGRWAGPREKERKKDAIQIFFLNLNLKFKFK
jgi:hypothetical protein